MLVVGFPAGAWATNCWVVAPGRGEQCVVIDPGHEAVDQLDDVLAEHRLQPIAVLLTHGHIDHTFSVVPVCGAKDVPALIHPADRHQLADPGSGLGLPPGTPILGRLDWAEPADVRELHDGEVLQLAGLSLQVDATPGHTPGSVTFTGDGQFFAGDLLFRDGVGRTDLPGGSLRELIDSLARVPLTLPDETMLRPGHGPDSTIGREKSKNPWLVDVAERLTRRGEAEPHGRGL